MAPPPKKELGLLDAPVIPSTACRGHLRSAEDLLIPSLNVHLLDNLTVVQFILRQVFGLALELRFCCVPKTSLLVLLSRLNSS